MAGYAVVRTERLAALLQAPASLYLPWLYLLWLHDTYHGSTCTYLTTLRRRLLHEEGSHLHAWKWQYANNSHPNCVRAGQRVYWTASIIIHLKMVHLKFG